MAINWRVCNVPGCPELTTAHRCEEHAADQRRRHQQAHDARRPTARQRGYDKRWERERAAYLSRYPDCERCGEPATDVHHVDGLGPLGPRGYDWTNFESLCRPCHSRLTASGQH